MKDNNNFLTFAFIIFFGNHCLLFWPTYRFSDRNKTTTSDFKTKPWNWKQWLHSHYSLNIMWRDRTGWWFLDLQPRPQRGKRKIIYVLLAVFSLSRYTQKLLSSVRSWMSPWVAKITRDSQVHEINTQLPFHDSRFLTIPISNSRSSISFNWKFTVHSLNRFAIP